MGHVARMGYRIGVNRILVGKPEGGRERQLEIPRRRWEYNIKMGLQVVGCGAWTGSMWFRWIENGHL